MSGATNTGGPAFPCTEANYTDPRWSYEGMTLRDYFAAKANEQDIVDCLCYLDKPWPDNARQIARYIHADAMLKSREA